MNNNIIKIGVIILILVWFSGCMVGVIYGINIISKGCDFRNQCYNNDIIIPVRLNNTEFEIHDTGIVTPYAIYIGEIYDETYLYIICNITQSNIYVQDILLYKPGSEINIIIDEEKNCHDEVEYRKYLFNKGVGMVSGSIFLLVIVMCLSYCISDQTKKLNL